MPLGVYAVFGQCPLLVGMTVFSSLMIAALVYGFFMTVGSVEYDNEEKTDRLRRANIKLEAYATRTGSDLRRARGVQQKLLPSSDHMPMSDRLAWAGSFVPETEVGGDYFDVAMLDEKRVAIIFTDVSGHGMSAAFITAIIKTAFQTWVDDGDGGGDFRDFVGDLNSKLYRLTPDDSFATAFVAVYDSDANQVDYINCGHSPEPWLIPASRDAEIVTLDDARNVLLGVLPEMPLAGNRKQIGPGDKLVFATDGLPEAFNARSELFGIARLKRLIVEQRALPIGELVDRLVSAVGEFSDGVDQMDDQTVLGMEVRS